MKSAAHRHCRQSALSRGLSIIEMMCALAITLVLLGGALPMVRDLRAGQALQATAALLETDIQLAKSEAASGSMPVRLSIQSLGGGGSCYTVHTGAAQACRCQGGGQAQCDAGARLLRLEDQPGAGGITLAPVQRSILFDGGKGTVTPTATIKVTDRDGRVIHQIINIMGRVRTCTPNRSWGGLKPC